MTVVNGVRLVSNSEVGTFQDCPRKWWLAWYRGLTPLASDEAGALAIGTRIHEALASYYVPEGKDPQNPVTTLTSLQANVYDLQFGTENVSWETVQERTLDVQRFLSVFDLEKAMISGYIEWLEETGADADLEVVASEQYVEVDLPGGDGSGNEAKLIGKLDAKVRHRLTGQVKFIDHKTVGTFNVPGLRQNPQMLHYNTINYLQSDKLNVAPEGALYNMLRKVKRSAKSKPPYFQRTTISHNHFEIEAHLERIYNFMWRVDYAEQDLQGVTGGGHHRAVPARPSSDCHWKCPFFKICPMFDDGSRVEAAIEAQYEVKNPLHYYGGKEIASE